ncbi:hypothetical protein DFQ28_007179 [Apophysomyces sp. BC1034]|nr:hypothetical protein DFQ28_007179 [Apophysomyces sp. BC1034]
MTGGEGEAFGSAGKKRKRLTQACIVCRKKKTKCDGVRPICGNCSRLHQDCQYIASNKKRGPRQSHIDLLEKRLSKMEAMLNRESQSEQPDDEGLFPTSSEPNEDLIQEPQSLDEQPAGNNLLPSTAVVNHLVELYFKHLYGTFPIFDRETLLKDIREGKCSRFLLFAILAVAARFSDMPEVKENPPWQAGEKYACKARSFLGNVIDEPCIANVQGLVLLSMHEYGCGRGPRCWMYCGIAIRLMGRMALEMDLHKEIITNKFGEMIPIEQWVEYEVRRKLFWDLFLQDKFASAATGRPPCLQEEDCDVLLASEEESLVSKEQFCSVSINGETVVRFELGWPAHIIWETVLLGRVTKFVNRSMKRRNTFTPDDPDSEFAQLDRQIDDWEKNLPLHMRNTPANLERHRSSLSNDSSRFVLAHVLHNALIVLLHRPALVLAEGPLSEDVRPEIRDHILLSVDKCMTAADNVTVMLKNINSRLELLPPFLTYLAYIMATIVVNNSFSPKPEEAQRAQMALAEHFRLLQAMRSYWAMADKLYFMIRDLYAMHKNVMRRMTCKESDNESVDKVMQSQPSRTWPTQSPQQPQPLPVVDTTFGRTDNIYETTLEQPNPTSDQVLVSSTVRRMPLADLSLSTSDWASLTDWQQGAYQETIMATRQTIGRTVGATDFLQGPTIFDDMGMVDAFSLDLDLDIFDTGQLQQAQAVGRKLGN